MGVTIRQKNKSRGAPWYVFVTQDGVRKSRKVGSKKAAKAVADAIEEKMGKGEFGVLDKPKKEMPTFGEYSGKWIKYIRTMRRQSTHESYKQKLDGHVLPVFKDRKLDTITRGDIRDYLLSKAGKFSASTVCLHRDVLSGVFNFAIDEELIPSNPAYGITKRLNLSRNKKEVEPLTAEELNLLLETARKKAPEYYAFFFTLARTGVRLGEALALRWGDIDFNGQSMWIKRSYRRGVFTAPKNGKTRKVDMSAQLQAELKSYKVKQQKVWLKRGQNELPELIFNRFGRPIEQNFVRRIYERMLTKAGMRHIKMHGLRHTFASLLLSAGESPVYVKEQLGHHSIQITVDIYGHWIQSKKSAGVNQLDGLACTPTAPTENTKAVTG